MIEPVVKELTVPVAPARAFDIFTRQFAQWWPVASHSLSASDGKLPRSITISPGIGGCIEEELHDGSRARWGVTTNWQPGRKLAFSWHLRHPEAEQTHVCIEFLPSGSGTLLRMVHSDWDNMGAEAVSAREQYNSGWDHVLIECFAGTAV
jgi:activator of Hsp90 ATPase-like protein